MSSGGKIQSFTLTTKHQTTRQISTLPTLPGKRSTGVFGDFFSFSIARKRSVPLDSVDFFRIETWETLATQTQIISDVVKTTRRRECIYFTYLRLSAGISVYGKGASLNRRMGSDFKEYMITPHLTSHLLSSEKQNIKKIININIKTKYFIQYTKLLTRETFHQNKTTSARNKVLKKGLIRSGDQAAVQGKMKILCYLFEEMRPGSLLSYTFPLAFSTLQLAFTL